MTILSRYLVREFLKSSSAVLLVLLVLMMGNTLVKLLTQSADGELASAFIWPLMMLYLANYIVVLLGLSSFFGILLAFGRLYKDVEMSAMVACGVGPRELLKPLTQFVLGVSLFCLLLTVYVLPGLARLQIQLQKESERPNIETHLRAGEFNHIPDGVFFLEKYEDDVLHNAFIYRKEKQEGEWVQVAKSGTIRTTETGYSLQLNEGAIYQVYPDGRMAQIRFDQYEVFVEAPKLPIKQDILEAQPTSVLFAAEDNQSVAEWQWRFSLPIGVLLLAYLAFPLSYTTPRKGGFAKMGYAVLVFVLYNYTLSFGKSLVIDGKVPQWLGLWWVHIPVVVLFFYLMIKHYGSPAHWGGRHD